MHIWPLLYIEHADPRDVFGSVSAPEVTFAETMNEANSLPGVASSLVRYDRALNCLYLEPQYQPADEVLVDWTTNANQTFKLAQNRVTGKAVIRRTGAAAGHEDEGWTAERGAAGDPALPDGTGLYLWLYRDAPRPASTRDAAHCYVAARLLTADGRGFRVSWPYGGPPVLQRTEDSGATWLDVGEIPIADGGKATTGGAGELLLELVRVNGRIAFRGGTAANALNEKPLSVPDLDLVWPLKVAGRNANCGFACFPVTWPAGGTWDNCERDRPWYNTSTPVLRAEGSARTDPTQPAPDGVTLSMVDTGTDWTLRYEIAMAPVAGVTPYVTQVRVRILAVEIAPDPFVAWTQLPYATGFSLTHRFDPVECTVRAGGRVYVRNHEGQYATFFGCRAVRIWAGLACENGVIWGGYGSGDGLRFTGLLNLDRDIGTEDGWLSLDDLSFRPREKSPLLNPPQQDTNCIYNAVKQYAQYSGVTDSWFAVGPGAPVDSWTCDGVTCDPAAGHLRLGNGTGFNPIWRPGQGESAWEAQQRIRRLYGMALGYRPDGKFTMYPWEPWKARAAWSPVNIYSSVPAYSAGLPQLNEFLAGLRCRTSIRELVNSLTLLGIDPETWLPVLAHRYDDSSTGQTMGLGLTPSANYLGFLSAAVESSIAYSSSAEAEYVIDRLFNVLRQPRLTVYPLPVWAQPVFPLDYVGIAGSRVLAGDDKFYLSQVDELWETTGTDQRYLMNLTADLVPYDLGDVTTDAEAAFGVNQAPSTDFPTSYGIIDQSEAGSDVLAVY